MTTSLTNPKIVVLHPGALGDGLVSLPTIRGLSRHYPKHKLIWVGHGALGEVFLKAGEVHESFSFDSLQVGHVCRSDSSMHAVLQSCDSTRDLMVGWMNDKEGYWTAWAQKLGYSRYIFRSPHDRQLTGRHMIERYREVLIEGNRGLCPPPVQNDFRTMTGPFPADKPVGGTFETKSPETKIRILLHPGSGSPQKCTGADLFASVARQLLTRFPDQVGLISGPADIQYLCPIRSLLIDLNPPYFENLDLLTVCGFFQQIELFIGHDSGLSHLAATLGVTSLLLFGPTEPGEWAPRGPHVHVRRDRDLQFSPDDLDRLAEQLVQKNPRNLVA